MSKSIHEWHFLERVDRHHGSAETTRLADPAANRTVARAAEYAGMTEKAAWDVLLNGGHVTTFGYVYRLKGGAS